MDEVIQVQTTLERREDAERIGRALVEARLAACAQLIGPIHSTYRWQGMIHDAEEWLLLLKTRRGDFARLEAELQRLHPYEVPEVIALPVVAGSAGYLDWVLAQTGG